ncbi:glycosyltransferase [Fibrella sp. HMF5036]|uniref:Glycosyltransferase n=1 Tax=Fibrella aquatilis TaxID=2817059 RepID=A0A939G7D8_9BACT|nr:glycosyltransferase [Fibrella aquatilis]
MLWPRISIVMPSYNQAEFIRESIQSVLNQNYPNLEFIIIDGGSTDGTVNIIKEYECQLAYWISEPDNGQSHALNKGFNKATGNIMGWLNSDDLYTKYAFLNTINTFKRFPGLSVVFADYYFINKESRYIEYKHAFNFKVNQLYYEGWFLNVQSMFWTAEAHKRFGHFDINLHRNMDYDFVIRMGLNEGYNRFYRLNDIALGCFRLHENQKTRGMNDITIREQYLISSKINKLSKFTMIGKILRYVFRLRRLFWYIKRKGFLTVVNLIRKKISL